MPAFTAFNIGKDKNFRIEIENIIGAASTSTGVALTMTANDLGLITDSSTKPNSTTVTVKPCNKGGANVHRESHDDWDISISGTRQDDTIEQLAQALQDASLQGGGAPKAKITETIFDPRGAAYGSTIWVYPDVTLKVEDLGSYSGDNPVNWRITGKCPRRFPGGVGQQSAAGTALAAAAAAASAAQVARGV